MQSEVFEAFRDLGVAEDKAMRAAAALSGRDEAMVQVSGDLGGLKRRLDGATDDIGELKSDVAVVKADVTILKVDVSALKADVSVLKVDVAALKVDVALLKWMTGFSLAINVAVLLKLLIR